MSNCRFAEAFASRLWGAAECCRESQLIEQLGRLDLAPEVQPAALHALKVSPCIICILHEHKQQLASGSKNARVILELPTLMYNNIHSIIHRSSCNALGACCLFR